MVDRLLAGGAPAKRCAFPAGRPSALEPFFDGDGAIRTTPAATLGGKTGLDGFYAVALTRL